MDLQTINVQASKDILSLDWVLIYLQVNYPRYQIKSVTPYTFTLGSNNHSEGLELTKKEPHTLFFGKLQLDINPNGDAFANDNISLKIHSLFNPVSFDRHLTRIIEIQNYINEQTERIELFDNVEITSNSILYDTYLSFIGFKIEYN